MELGTKRSSFFDNAKIILILLVVIGHIIEPLILIKSFRTLYLFIYSFHIPAFILISGYFAKSFKVSHNKMKLVKRLLLLYVVFELVYSVFNHLVFETARIKLSILNPYWILWFLLSLLFWHFMLLCFLELKYPLVFAVILSVLVGYMSNVGYFLSLSRTIAFFPFFLLGYYVRELHVKRLSHPKNRLLALSFFIIVLLVLYKFAPDIDVKWLYGSYPYSKLGHIEWYAGVYRLAILLTGLAMSLAFFALIPHRKTFFTDWGSRTLYIYLLHGFIIKLLVRMDFYKSYNWLWNWLI